MRDEIYAEIDRRKVERLVDHGVISREEIENAPIVFQCECGQEQDVDNDRCIKCGKDIS